MRRLILGFAVVAPLLLVALWSTSWIAAIGVLALSHALLLYPTLRPNVQWWGPVVTRFRTDKREIWLTVDDGPTDDTPAILDLFDARGVKATFFLKGELAQQRPDLVREMIARGHSVANHSQTHPSGSFWCLPPSKIAQQIDQARAVLEPLGAVANWFRAPVGMKNPAVHPYLARRHMRLIGWTIRSFDANARRIEPVVRRVLPQAEPGAILVMHQGRDISRDCLARVIDELHALGYAFVIPTDDQLV